jgi:hypothetical protein
MLEAREFVEEEEDEEEEEEAAAPKPGPPQPFHTFATKAHGVLFKIDALSEEVCAEVEEYMKGGAMQRDLTFVDTLYGIVTPTQTKEYSLFWESPWVEEQIKESGKKRKVEQQQRTMAVRSFIRASTTTQETTEDVDKFLQTVDKLTEWDKHNHGDQARENIKTVSRMVQSFEKRAIMSLNSVLLQHKHAAAATQHMKRLGEIDCAAHSLRRAPATYVAFASLVAAELFLSEANNGSRNISINMSRRMDLERFNALNAMIEALGRTPQAGLPKDTVGLPLMKTNANVTISRGVLVVSGKGQSRATYVLDIENFEEIMSTRKNKHKKGLDKIEITAQIFEEADAAAAVKQQPAAAAAKKKTTSTKGTTPLASLV